MPSRHQVSAGFLRQVKLLTCVAFTVALTNLGPPSAMAAVIAPPRQPVITSVYGGDGYIDVWFVGDGSHDSGADGYYLTLMPGGRTVYAPANPTLIQVFGLSNGTTYTVTLTGYNALGDSVPSEPKAVTPGWGTGSPPATVVPVPVTPASTPPCVSSAEYRLARNAWHNEGLTRSGVRHYFGFDGARQWVRIGVMKRRFGGCTAGVQVYVKYRHFPAAPGPTRIWWVTKMWQVAS